MQYNPKVRPSASTITNPITLTLVGEPDDGEDDARLDAADLYARRIAREAEAWLALARERTRLRDDALTRKALDAVASTMRHRAHSLFVPTKLAGVMAHQPALWRLVRDLVRLGTALDVREEHGTVVVSYGGDDVGSIQRKHLGWLVPLLPFGTRVYLLRVTGHERQGYTLGLNVAVGHTGAAVLALRHALGQSPLGQPLNRPLPTPQAGLSGDGRGGSDLPRPSVA